MGAGFVLNIGDTDSLAAELWGVRAGLMLARELQLPNVIVELDAAIVVQFLTLGLPIQHPYSVLVHDALQLITEGWVSKVRHILREGNRCADFLANLAQSKPFGVTILSEPPSGLLQLLHDDLVASPALRH